MPFKPDLKLPNRPADATHTTTLRSRYQTQLKNLFAAFKNEITPALNRLQLHEGMMDEVSRLIDGELALTIHAPSRNVIKQNITIAYRTGKKRASDNPRIKRSRLTIPYQLNFLDQQVVEDLRVRNFGLVRGATADMKNDMLRIMTEGIQQQRSTQVIAKNMTKEITGFSRKRATLIAQTEIAHSYNNAISKSYQDAGIQKWQWMASFGERTCPICEANHGLVFNWGDPQPPEHPRCLCTIYPIIDKKFERELAP